MDKHRTRTEIIQATLLELSDKTLEVDSLSIEVDMDPSQGGGVETVLRATISGAEVPASLWTSDYDLAYTLPVCQAKELVREFVTKVKSVQEAWEC